MLCFEQCWRTVFALYCYGKMLTFTSVSEKLWQNLASGDSVTTEDKGIYPLLPKQPYMATMK